MKNNWTLISLGIGLGSGLLTYFYFQNFKWTIASGIIAFVIFLLLNPKKRYFRAFWIVFSLIIGLNKFFFEFSGNLFGVEFKVASGTTDIIVTVALILLAAFCLLLDYLQQNNKLSRNFFQYNKNSIRNRNIVNSKVINNQNINKK